MRGWDAGMMRWLRWDAGPNLASKIPNQTTNPEHYLGNQLAHELLISEVDAEEYEEMLSSLKRCSPGYDDFNKDMLFLSLPDIGFALFS